MGLEDDDALPAPKKIHVIKRIHLRAHSKLSNVRDTMLSNGLLPKVTPVKPTTFLALLLLSIIPPIFFIGLFSVSKE